MIADSESARHARSWGLFCVCSQKQKNGLQPSSQQRSTPEHGPSSSQRQLPLVQRLVLSPQRLPHDPQLFRSFDKVLQLALQQVWPEPQLAVQLPQCASSLLRLAQVPPQQVWPEPQFASV